MQSQMYPAAQELLMKDITDIDKTVRRAHHARSARVALHVPSESLRCMDPRLLTLVFSRPQLHAVKYQDHLLYHYLGGTILALLGEYARAAELLEIVRPVRLLRSSLYSRAQRTLRSAAMFAFDAVGVSC